MGTTACGGLKQTRRMQSSANYGLDHWLALPKYIPEDDVRLMLKTTYRQYQQYAKVQTMLKNNRIGRTDRDMACRRFIGVEK